MTPVKVSIIIPVYNMARLLPRCLDSALGQSLKEIEIICIDDGSTDAGWDILQQYATQDTRLILLRQPNQGSGPARNNGLEKASGEFVAFMDADDFYPDSEVLQHLYENAVANGARVCGGSLRIEDNRGQHLDVPKRFAKSVFPESGFINFADYQYVLHYFRFIFQRRLIRENNIKFPPFLRTQDPIWFARAMAAAGSFYAVPRATYVYRADYGKTKWTRTQRLDGMKGIMSMLEFAHEHHMDKLYEFFEQRMCEFSMNLRNVRPVDLGLAKAGLAHYKMKSLFLTIKSFFHFGERKIIAKKQALSARSAEKAFHQYMAKKWPQK